MKRRSKAKHRTMYAIITYDNEQQYAGNVNGEPAFIPNILGRKGKRYIRRANAVGAAMDIEDRTGKVMRIMETMF